RPFRPFRQAPRRERRKGRCRAGRVRPRRLSVPRPCQGARGEELADLGRLLGLRALERLLQLLPARGGDRLARVVVDELGGDAQIRAEDGEARTLRGAAHLAANAAPAALPELFFSS